MTTKTQPFVAEIGFVVESVVKGGHIPSHCTYSTVPNRDPDGYQLHIANICDEVRRSDLEDVFVPYSELNEVWLGNSIPCFDLLFTKIKKMLQLPPRLAMELKYAVVALE